MTKVLTVQRLIPVALVVALALAFGTYANAQTTEQYYTTTPPPTTSQPLTTTPPTTSQPLTTTPPTTSQPLTTTPPSTGQYTTTPPPTTSQPLTTTPPTTTPLPASGGFSLVLLPIAALLLLGPGVLIFAVRRLRS
jgi:hypothetical protein